MFYPTMQDRIDQAVEKVMALANRARISEEEAEDVVEDIRDLGYQWQQSNAHGHALSIELGLMATGEELRLPLDDGQLKALEASGCEAALENVPMAVYMDLVMHFLPKPEVCDDGEEENGAV